MTKTPRPRNPRQTAEYKIAEWLSIPSGLRDIAASIDGKIILYRITDDIQQSHEHVGTISLKSIIAKRYPRKRAKK